MEGTLTTEGCTLGDLLTVLSLNLDTAPPLPWEAVGERLAPVLRRLQQYVVGIPPEVRAEWLSAGLLKPVHPTLGDAVLKLDNLSFYDEATGVRIDGGFGDGII